MIYRRKLFFIIFLILPLILSWAVTMTETNDDISLKYHNRYSKSSEHRQIYHPVSARPTSVGHALKSSPSQTSYRYTSPPTKHFYKSPSNMEIRRDGSMSEVPPVMRWKSPPNINPWYTLYRPSVAPHYPLHTKKPVEPSWKPAHMVLDEVPKVPLSRLQETNSRHHPPPKEYYKHMFGTQEGIKHIKTHYGPTNLSEAKSQMGLSQSLDDVRLANEHFLRMRSSTRCKVPAPEVVCVKDLYPNSSKDYLPRCTQLHRCGDRSGCCDSETLKCMPKAIQEVALNFYVVHSHMPTAHVGLENSVEKLFFTNHTECECVPNTDPTTPNPVTTQTPIIKNDPQEKILMNEGSAVNEDRPLQDNHKELRLNVVDEDDDEEEKDTENLHKKAKCRECPMPFSLRDYPDGRCTCDCFDKQKPCLRIKRGRESLVHHEKRCVETNLCNIPECEYGVYITSSGRCPKKPDDLLKPGKNANYNPRSLHNPNHRWTYFERD